MTKTNNYGLTNYIPADVRREVRRQCGFGCVNCGCPFYDYEHWNPPFADLQTDPTADGVTLCCPSCHRKKGKLLSMDEYRANIAFPYALREGNVSTTWSKGFAPEFVLGNVVCSGGTRILEINNELMLGFHDPEESGAPPRLIARFYDRAGKECFRIVDNLCVGSTDSWDLTSTGIEPDGWRWVVRNGPRKIDLNLELYPPNRIVVAQMLWQYGPLRVVACPEGLQLSLRQGDSSYSNFLLMQHFSVKALQPEHSFLRVTRTTEALSESRINIRHDVAMANMELDGGGVGVFSMDPKAPLLDP